jgi:hypothetical protein
MKFQTLEKKYCRGVRCFKWQDSEKVPKNGNANPRLENVFHLPWSPIFVVLF